MHSNEEHYYSFRRKELAHEDSILSRHSAMKTEQNFKRLADRVFGYHGVYHVSRTVPAWPTRYSDDDLPPRECIDRLFYEDFFRPVEITQGFDGATISADDFISVITRNTEGDKRNNVRYLIGDTGTGKSCFICSLIVKNGAKWLDRRPRAILPIRVDMDVQLKTRHKRKTKYTSKESDLPRITDLLLAVYDSIHAAVKEARVFDPGELTRLETQTAFDSDQQSAKAEEAVANFIHAIINTKIYSPLIIIDNLDFLYHIYDRGLFAGVINHNQNPTPEQNVLETLRRAAFDLIEYLLRMFLDPQSPLGHLGINTLVVLRRDSLSHYMHTTRRDVPAAFDLRTHTFRLKGPALEDALDAHSHLLKATIERMPRDGRASAFMEAANAMDLTLRREGPANLLRRRLHDDMVSLSKQGLRQIMQHHKDFIWATVCIEQTGDQHVVATRFTEQYSPPLLAFLLRGHRLFSQLHCAFPNIYLVRSDALFETNSPWSSLLGPHKHTYWLKRLILEYIGYLVNKQEAVTPLGILKMFSQTYGDEYCFEDSIVRLCLGSMAQVDYCHLIDFEFASAMSGPSTVVESISLTSRGRRLLSNFIDSFTYLQLLTDDYLLPIPSCVSEEFKYDGSDYGYLVAPRADYSQRLEHMLKRKIRQVFCFLEILRVSLDYEKIVFSTVFENLKRKGVPTPNPDSIIHSVEAQLETITKHVANIDYTSLIPDRTEIQDRLKKELERAYLD